MGNRAVVIFEDDSNVGSSVGVYLHWNGGPESVLAFMQATKERCGRIDFVGFVQTAANYFDYSGLNLYVGPVDTLDQDNDDNGTYHIKAGEIVSRKFMKSHMRSQGSLVTSADQLSKARFTRYEGILAECRADTESRRERAKAS